MRIFGSRFANPIPLFIAASVASSLFPVIVFRAGEDISVWMFTAAMEFVSAALFAILLAVSFKGVFCTTDFQWQGFLPARSDAGPTPLLLGTVLLLTAFNVVWYLLATRLIPLIVVVFVTEGLSPLAMAAILGRWGRHSGRLLAPRNAFLMVGMGVAAGMIVSSQVDVASYGDLKKAVIGVALAVVTAIIFGIRPVAAVLYGERCVEDVVSSTTWEQRLWWTMFITAAASLVAAAVLAVSAVVAVDTLERSLVFGSLAGSTATVGMFFLRAGSAASIDTRWHAILYFSPALGVLWVWLAGGQISNPVQYITAVAAILGLNILNTGGKLARR